MAATSPTPVAAGTRLLTRGSGLIGIEALAREAGIHPELARRLIRLGLIEPTGGTRAAPLFRRNDALVLVSALRLRRDLGLNYAGAVLACELLARIDELERRLAVRVPTDPDREVIAWTPIA